MTDIKPGLKFLVTQQYQIWLLYSEYKEFASYNLDIGAEIVIDSIKSETAECISGDARVNLPVGLVNSILSEQFDTETTFDIPLHIGDIVKFNKEHMNTFDIPNKFYQSLGRITAIDEEDVTIDIGGIQWTVHNVPFETALEMKSLYNRNFTIASDAASSARALNILRQIDSLYDDLEGNVNDYFEEILKEIEDEYALSFNKQSVFKLLKFILPSINRAGKYQWQAHIYNNELCLENTDISEYVIIPSSKIPKKMDMGNIFSEGLTLADKLIKYADRLIMSNKGIITPKDM